MRRENHWTAGTRISALSWSTDPRVRVIAADEEYVTDALSRRQCRLLALILTWWFLCCVLWFGLSYLFADNGFNAVWQICKYGGMVVGVVAALFGAVFAFGFVITRGRLFYEDGHQDF